MKLFLSYREGYGVPQWKMPLTLSVVIHLLVVVLIVYVPQAKKDSGTPFVTRLVSPDELSKLFQEEPSGGRLPEREMKARPSVPVPPVPRTARPSRSPRAAPAAPPPALKPGPGEAEKGPAPGVGADGLKNKELPAQEASPGAPAIMPRGGSPGSGQRGPVAAPSPSLREKLFDREIVQKYAKREESAHDNSITFDTREFKYQAYMIRLKERIEGIWKYPPEAARKGIKGDLLIRFTIKKNGRLADVEIERPSGYRDLDEAAMQALKDGEPYWPLPDEWGKDSFTITGHFVYSLYGAYIR